ncbi:hypothetical protein D3C74_50000 [compost metagenome]
MGLMTNLNTPGSVSWIHFELKQMGLTKYRSEVDYNIPNQVTWILWGTEAAKTRFIIEDFRPIGVNFKFQVVDEPQME